MIHWPLNLMWALPAMAVFSAVIGGVIVGCEWLWLTIALALAMCGCARAHLIVKPYPDVIIIKAWPPGLIDDFCSAEAGKWDNGKPKKKGAPVGGCEDDRPTIWVKSDSSIPHEKAHQAGVENPKADGYDR